MCSCLGCKRGIQVKPVVTVTARPGSGSRCRGYCAGCCRKGPRRQRITTAWGIGSCWADGKAVATQRDGEQQPITARCLTMHNVSQGAICKVTLKYLSKCLSVGGIEWTLTSPYLPAQKKKHLFLFQAAKKKSKSRYYTVKWVWL